MRFRMTRDQHKPARTAPPDFERFWAKTRRDLAEVDPGLQREERPECAAAHRVVEHLSFRSLGGGWVRGYLIRWQDRQPRPLVIHSHGYGSACEVRSDWAARGLNVLGVDIRGFGRSFESQSLLARGGWILTGIQSPETSILRGAVCDYMRAVEIGCAVFGQTNRLILNGYSFSGGLALMAEAQRHAADLLVVGVPTFGWAEGRFFFVKSGSGAEIRRYIERRPEEAEDVMLVLRYFDPINFASSITCPSLVGVGLADDVVPAKTVYAITNHLSGPHEIMEFPVSHSTRPEQRLWVRFDERWLEWATRGVPDDFGRAG